MICRGCNKHTPVIKGNNLCPACHVIEFITRYCTHIKGRWAQTPFTLIPWQEELLRKVFGTLNEKGKRQYRTVYCEIGKKNGKSELASALALYMLCADGEVGGEVYSAAGDREQASLVYYPAAQMIRNNSRLSERLKIIDSRKRVVDYNSNSYYQVLSSESFTKHGLNPSAVIFDEIHAQPNRELWDVLTEGTNIAREQQLVLVITTAGVADKESIGWQLHDKAVKIRDGIIEDTSFLPVLYCADEEDDWEDPKVWEKVNPSLGHIFEMESLQKAYEEVKADPSRQNNFMRFRLNRWVGQVTRYIPMDRWDDCDDLLDLESLNGKPCFGGLDLSTSIDLSAFALIFPPEQPDGKWPLIVKFYIPEENILERVRRDGVNYDIWVRSGLITATPGNVIDYSFIRRDINKAALKYDLRELAYDPWGAVKLAVELREEDGINMVEHRQGFKSMSPPTKEFYNLVVSRRLVHGNNPVLRWNANNLSVKVDAAENKKPEKDKSTDRIDGIVASIMALGRALETFEKPSIYNKQGLFVI